MTDARGPQDPSSVLERLHGAMNRHDLAGLVACFDEDYDSQQPVHPDRAFRGSLGRCVQMVIRCLRYGDL